MTRELRFPSFFFFPSEVRAPLLPRGLSRTVMVVDVVTTETDGVSGSKLSHCMISVNSKSKRFFPQRRRKPFL